MGGSEMDPRVVEVGRRARLRGLPDIGASPARGACLRAMAEAIGAGRILEVGTLGGEGAAWLAGSGAEVVSLEADSRFARIARASLHAVGLGERVEVRAGYALPEMELMVAAGEGFDMCVVDGDKRGSPAYVKLATELVRQGGVLVVDDLEDARVRPAVAWMRECGAWAVSELWEGKDGFAVGVRKRSAAPPPNFRE